MFCPSCGKEIRSGASYCPHCGRQVTVGAASTQVWDDFAGSLANGSLHLAKGFAYVLIGGIAGACGMAAAAAFFLACYLIYHFANGVAVAIPWFLAEALPVASIGGVSLQLSGITSLIVTLLLGMAAFALIRCIRSGFCGTVHKHIDTI